MKMIKTTLVMAALAAGSAATHMANAAQTLLNVSYDPTRELYQEYNRYFISTWKHEHGQDVNVRMSHGGSGKQAQSVINGLAADVVTLSTAADIDAIAKHGLITGDWAAALPNHSVPYWTVAVFVVRKGNPKNIHDWEDLVRPGVQVITPNPKTSGAARWNFLAAYGFALQKELGDLSRWHPSAADATTEKARKAADAFVAGLYRNVPVLDSGGRGATTTFAQRGIGDVLVTYENEAELALNELGRDKFEIVVPSLTIRVETPVAVVTKVAAAHGTTRLAEVYLKGLYSHSAQEIVARHYYRPSDPAVLDQHSGEYKKVDTFTIDDVFGGWDKAQAVYFDDGGVFDQIYQPGK